MDRLLKYGFSTPEELERFRSKIGLRFDGDRFVVFLIHSRDEADIGGKKQYAAYSAARKAVVSSVAAAFDNVVWVHPCDMATFAVVLSWRGGAEEELRRDVTERCHRLWAALPARTRTGYRIAVGGICRSPEDLRLSYREAFETISATNVAGESPVLWSDAVHEERRSHAYSLAFEQRLTNQTLMGNKSEVERMLKGFYERSIANQQLSHPMLQVVRYEIIGTLIRIVQEAGLRERLDRVMSRVEQETTTERFFGEVLVQLLQICEAVAEDARTGEAESRQRIVELVRQNLGNANFTLDMLSHVAGAPPASVQRCLRKVTGLSFAKYLENLRIESSEHMLSSTEEPVQSIAAAVGYASDKSFRRAFRKLTGKSPAEYRAAARIHAAVRA
jgi:AraC-like DNA-binding protein